MLAGIACPVSLLEECATQGRYHMALSHLILESTEYREFYLRMSERGDFVSVDNGVVERGKALSLQEVLTAAHAVRAKEVVLPDVLFDGKETHAAVATALCYLLSHNCLRDFRWLAVPHGKTFMEWLRCYFALLHIAEVDTIGISMFDHDLLPGGRPQILDVLEQLDLLDSMKDYHMLGCWKDLREVWFLEHSCTESPTWYGPRPMSRGWVRSIDTGIPVRLGLIGYRHPTMSDPMSPPPFIHRREDFHAKREMNEHIQWNIELYKQWCEE